MSTTTTTPTTGSWPQFLLWTLTGGVLALGVLSLLTIGIFVLPVGLIAAAVLLWRRGLNRSVVGAVSGAGLPWLYIAWGSARECSEDSTCTGTGVSWPLIAVAVAVVVTGLVAFGLTRKPSTH